MFLKFSPDSLTYVLFMSVLFNRRVFGDFPAMEFNSVVIIRGCPTSDFYPFESGMFMAPSVVCTDGRSLKAREECISATAGPSPQSCPLWSMVLLSSALS